MDFKKKCALFLVLFLFFVCNLPAQQWKLVWSDEFDGTTINTANWVFDTGAGCWGNDELEYYTNRSDNACCKDGNLLIIGKKETYEGSEYTSARLKTQGKQSWTYGKVEARMKMPLGKGLWPAFWMLGESISTVSWPACGEIDIMEHVNTDSTICATMHWDESGHQSFGGWKVISGIRQYHTYAVEWDSTDIKWLIDGEQYFSGNMANNANGNSSFRKPFFILLNLAIGGGWPGSPDVTTLFPDTVFVDYVRVYQNQPTVSLTNPGYSDTELRVSSNPVTENSMLSFNGKQDVNYQIEISDLLGKVYLKKTIRVSVDGKEEVPLSLTALQPGLYLASVKGEGRTNCLKLIKK
jgi:beta-glucanase (GH16 family)